MRFHIPFKPIIVGAAATALAVTGFATREWWLPRLHHASPAEPVEAGEVVTPTAKIIVNEHAQQNLGLSAKPLKAETFWRTIPVPGMVVDRPGLSDRSVAAPATGVVARIARYPGSAVQ